LYKKYSLRSKKASVNVSFLKPDIYIVRIFSQGKIEEHKIIVQH